MRRLIIVLLVIIAIGAAAYFYINSQGGLDQVLNRGDAGATATPLPPVQASTDVTVDAVVVPARYADLSLSASGTVAEVLVEEGDLVEAGQVLARLANDRQVIAIAQAEAQVRSAQARLDELRAGARSEDIDSVQASVDIARANLTKLVDGSRPEDVTAAQAALNSAQANLQELLKGADNAQLVQALANLQNAEAALQQAQAAYDLVKWNPQIGALPQSAALQQASNNYEAAKANYDLLAAGAKDNEIAAAQAQVEQARANLDRAQTPGTAGDIAAAEAQVRQAEAQLALSQAGARPETIAASEADLTQAQTSLMQRQLELKDTELRVPFAGTVASLSLEVGEQVGAGTPVGRIADQTEWHIETDDLTELNVVYVQEGDTVLITVDALPDLEMTGVVTRIKPLGENKQGDITYTATIVPDTYEDRLRWNMTASVTIQTTQSD